MVFRIWPFSRDVPNAMVTLIKRVGVPIDECTEPATDRWDNRLWKYQFFTPSRRYCLAAYNKLDAHGSWGFALSIVRWLYRVDVDHLGIFVIGFS